MNVGAWQREYEVAVRTVREAVVLARDVRERAGEQVWLKADWSPVTVADFAVQALIAERLATAFPGDPLVAEEDAAALREPSGDSMVTPVLTALRRAAPDVDWSGALDLIDRGVGEPGERFWTLDPIDGTQGFVRGDQYVVALALIVRGQVALGLIGCPRLALSDRVKRSAGWIACAVRGGGALQASVESEAFSPLHVSSCRATRSARVLRSFEAGHIDVAGFDAIVKAFGTAVEPGLMDSQAKHVVVASGDADLLIRVPITASFHDKIWDQAAGCLIIEEAGGRVTDLSGSTLDFGTGRLLSHNWGVIASNGLLHVAALNAVQQVIATRP